MKQNKSLQTEVDLSKYKTCPKCDKEMSVKFTDTSFDPDINIRYTRDVFVCEKDNIWFTVEIPIKSVDVEIQEE